MAVGQSFDNFGKAPGYKNILEAPRKKIYAKVSTVHTTIHSGQNLEPSKNYKRLFFAISRLTCAAAQGQVPIYLLQCLVRDLVGWALCPGGDKGVPFPGKEKEAPLPGKDRGGRWGATR